MFLLLVITVVLSISGVSANCDSVNSVSINNYIPQDVSSVNVDNNEYLLDDSLNEISSFSLDYSNLDGDGYLLKDSKNLEVNTNSLDNFYVASSTNNNLNIQEMINNAKSGDTLVLSDDYINVNTPIIIDKSLTIDGNGSIIDGNSLSQLFYINSSHVILKNLKIINALNSNELGGAIFWNGSYGLVFNCSFVNNSAYKGGAIFWNGSYGLVFNCSFVNNSAYKGGSINWNGENGIVKYSSFVNNSAYKGGAINWDEDDGKVKYCFFVNNSAYKGGAIYWDEPTGSIKYCFFVNNSAYKGGAIYLEDGKIKIVGCYFLNNHNDDVYLENKSSNCEFNSKFSIENTGNPIILLIISLLSILCISIKSKR